MNHPLSQAQWYEKIKSWVPSWFFDDEVYSEAVFQALAKAFSQADSEMRSYLADTFILSATGYTLDQFGYERNIIRYANENDAQYLQRIRNMANVLTPSSLILLANTFLITGEAKLIEHEVGGIFTDSESFLTRQEVFTNYDYNLFSVVVPNQGTSPDAQTALNSIAQTINNSKALGTLYRLIETER